jgi:hypothetical protein
MTRAGTAAGDSPGEGGVFVTFVGLVVPILIWLGIALAFVAKLSEPPPDISRARKLGDLTIHDPVRSAGRGTYIERQVAWGRSDTVKFALDTASGLVEYLLVAAGALIGFLVKMVVDPIRDRTSQRLTRGTELFLIQTAVGCFLSLVMGVGALGMLPKVATQERFSIHAGDFAVYAAFQQVFFLVSILWLIVALVFLVSSPRGNPPSPAPIERGTPGL